MVVPRLSARCVNIRLGPIPALVQAPMMSRIRAACGRLAEQLAPQVGQDQLDQSR